MNASGWVRVVFGGVVVWAVAVNAAVEPNASLPRGAQAYLANCAVCHGEFGAGSGPLVGWLHRHNAPHPARLDASARMRALGLAGVQKIVSRGSAHVGRSGTMPSLGPHLGSKLANEASAWAHRLPSLTADERAAVEAWLAPVEGSEPEGRRDYVLYCSSCHGSDGRGDGYFSPSLRSRLHPRDLSDAARFAGVSDDSLRGMIPVGGPHAPDAPWMPGWMNTLDSTTVHATASYVRVLQRQTRGR